jgi:galactose mutarotase-like enzyme
VANYHLENGQFRVSIDSKGAEQKSFFSKQKQTEFIWQADPAFWAKSSPVLFPIVGSLKDGYYLYRGEKYFLPRHGFARDMDFELIDQRENQLCFLLEANEQTLKNYPFRFRLKIEYTLSLIGLTCTYIVENNDALENLPFSIGGHPAFRVPYRGGDYTDYFLEFEQDHELMCFQLNEGLLSDQHTVVELVDGKLWLAHELFYNDAMVIKGLKSRNIFLKHHQEPCGLEFSFEDFPFFGIWAARDAPFVCLEPWCGVTDHENSNNQLEQKEGIVSLAPGCSFQRSWSVSLV